MSESQSQEHETARDESKAETRADVEEERQRRLDPDNRPDRAEVDNTARQFDEEKGMFTDSPGYEEAEERFPPMGGQGA